MRVHLRADLQPAADLRGRGRQGLGAKVARVPHHGHPRALPLRRAHVLCRVRRRHRQSGDAESSDRLLSGEVVPPPLRVGRRGDHPDQLVQHLPVLRALLCVVRALHGSQVEEERREGACSLPDVRSHMARRVAAAELPRAGGRLARGEPVHDGPLRPPPRHLQADRHRPARRHRYDARRARDDALLHLPGAGHLEELTAPHARARARISAHPRGTSCGGFNAPCALGEAAVRETPRRDGPPAKPPRNSEDAMQALTNARTHTRPL
mmetsp:Transcript_158758/g.486007  ORF Transcript_158758/g.486007 Transcript_158758/m.486007 type:complete len:266 (-) Transcript_158758:5-802(-)